MRRLTRSPRNGVVDPVRPHNADRNEFALSSPTAARSNISIGLTENNTAKRLAHSVLAGRGTGTPRDLEQKEILHETICYEIGMSYISRRNSSSYMIGETTSTLNSSDVKKSKIMAPGICVAFGMQIAVDSGILPRNRL